MEDTRNLLQQFLSVPLADGKDIFSLFSQIPDAVYGCGEEPLQRYVYIPGTRKDRVLLVAHADTVWDAHYGNPMTTEPEFQKGVFFSTNRESGIGADDRAGCAMLWALRESGHSLLVVDGEEKGKVGAKYLRDSNNKLFGEINRHCFMLELDWRGTGECLYNQVDYTEKFRRYITDHLGFRDGQAKGGCDLQILCHRVCGVNLGVGYYNYHTPQEVLSVAEWENTYFKLRGFLEGPQRRFAISYRKRIAGNWRKCRRWVGTQIYKLLPFLREWKAKRKSQR